MSTKKSPVKKPKALVPTPEAPQPEEPEEPATPAPLVRHDH